MRGPAHSHLLHPFGFFSALLERHEHVRPSCRLEWGWGHTVFGSRQGIADRKLSFILLGAARRGLRKLFELLGLLAAVVRNFPLTI